MATLTIEFDGTLVHMPQESLHRVVVGAGTLPFTGLELVSTIAVPGATSFGTLPPTSTPGTFTLNGATITVGSAQLGPLTVNLPCIPHLSAFPFSPPLNVGVAENRQPPAAAYFVIRSGSLALAPQWTQFGTAYAKLTLEFPGSEASIEFESWSGGPAQSVTIALPADLLVRSLPANIATSEDPLEWSCNFFVAPPPGPFDQAQLNAIGDALNAMAACVQTQNSKLHRIENDTVPSCSNSQWP